jgi:hypothetical protein
MAQYVTYLDFYVALQNCTDSKKSDFLFSLLSSCFPLEVSEDDIKIIKRFIKNFISSFQKRWSKSHRHASTFTKQNLSWLNSNIRWPSCKSIDLYSIFSRDAMNTQEDLSPLSQSMEAGPSHCNVSTNTSSQHRKAFADLTNKQKKGVLDRCLIMMKKK